MHCVASKAQPFVRTPHNVMITHPGEITRDLGLHKIPDMEMRSLGRAKANVLYVLCPFDVRIPRAPQVLKWSVFQRNVPRKAQRAEFGGL